MENSTPGNHEQDLKSERSDNLDKVPIPSEGGHKGGNGHNENDHARSEIPPPKQPWFWTRPFWSEGKRIALSLMFDFLLLAVTGTYTYYARKQWSAMNGQIEQMQASGRQTDQMLCLIRQQLEQITKQTTNTHDLAVAAGTQAAAATVQATVSREALISVQRAFMVFKDLNIEKVAAHFPSGDKYQWRIYGYWENTGTTAAPRLLQHFAHNILSDEPTDKAFKGRGIDASYTISYAGPKEVKMAGPIFKPKSFVSTDPQSPTVFSTERHFFWGWIAYRDVFTNSKLHITEFCQELSGITIDTLNPTKNPSLVTSECKHHNCEDEYCADYKELSDLAGEELKKPN
jgi:hypothetical protein